eukprot:TRINITY_DN2086_c0_g1_i12.p1 TRINITY_DN2086_c0_g1~~TRINITY_DN2086_c0_g1_i12.p1  ORF type:complete len:244 (+),score=4.78 TRINITY_DN2086_c0_g1_i12:85-732(+)
MFLKLIFILNMFVVTNMEQLLEKLHLSGDDYSQILANCHDSRDPDACVACASSDIDASIKQHGCSSCADSENPWTCMSCLSSPSISIENKITACTQCTNSNSNQKCLKCLEIEDEYQLMLCMKCADSPSPEECKKCLKDNYNDDYENQSGSACVTCGPSQDFQACNYCYQKNIPNWIQREMCLSCSNSQRPYACADCVESTYSNFGGELDHCLRV